MKEPPDNDIKKLLDKYAPLAQLAGLFFIWQENKRTEQKISPWARWERFLLPAMVVLALGFIFKDMPETMGEIKDALIKQNDRIIVIETKIGDITNDLAEIKANVTRNRDSLNSATTDRFTGQQGADLEKRMRQHSDSADNAIIIRMESVADKLIDRINQSEKRMEQRFEKLENKGRNYQ